MAELWIENFSRQHHDFAVLRKNGEIERVLQTIRAGERTQIVHDLDRPMLEGIVKHMCGTFGCITRAELAQRPGFRGLVFEIIDTPLDLDSPAAGDSDATPRRSRK